MAPKSSSRDFSRIAYLSVTESAANTLTFNGLSVFSNVLGQKGMVLKRIEYLVPSTVQELMVGAGDNIAFGLSGSDTISSITLEDPEVYDYNMLGFQLRGTAASFEIEQIPKVKDLTGLPGGGILVPADRLYTWIQGASLASATNMTVRLFYDILDLSPADYLELAQAMRVLK